MVSKLWEVISGLLIPDPDPDFLPILYPGSRGQKGTGSRIRNTDSACGGSLNQRSGAASCTIAIDCPYRSPTPVGRQRAFAYSDKHLPSRRLKEGESIL
jgi:hypothetical protein